MALNIDELRERARRKLPTAVFDFIDGAAEDEVTLRRNREAFGRYALVPRVGIDVSAIDVAVTMLGQPLSVPLLLAPTGLCGMATSRGEIPAARAATEAGILCAVSCLSSVTLEEVSREAPGQHWFQLYVWKDRAVTQALVERATQHGYRVLVVTLDVPVLGQRERDVRNGATIPPRITLRNALDTLRRPGWLWKIARGPRVTFANVAAADPSVGLNPFALSPFINSLFDPTVTWKDLEWMRRIWKGPVAVKGVMTVEDARLAVEHGADAVIVSNHGGRQLDGAAGALDPLPEIVDAVGSRTEIILDGGIRRGTDMAKALALGARACMIGRPYLYGLGAAGQAGVADAIRILTSELRRAMALMGCKRIGDLGRSCLRPA
ncbi:MAG: alpha-hydroxy-acid oxidizing protein [Deltaproteobacteria bacterium]|nr:MAG: alpha-hydroxy-acid oxidizing protein [Deltaproteobacteria bacterium]TMB36013.1 MAG: alpha-hydroxy-acid oxidizing protein [Deltaproteobacteria bacterium]TMB36444.1 MAG: alpha-hydroxy-acid oxidizing protein [Deltaproteobacteria bacterium]